MKARTLFNPKILCLSLSLGFPFASAMAAGEANKEAEVVGQVEANTQTKVVVSREQIESGNEQEGYGDAVKSVPGAASNNAAGSANDALKFRGIQLGLYTNYRLNGGLAITNIQTIPTEDKEKVEALKGANALMFGLASPAGIINMVTKRAEKKDITTVTVSGNSWGQIGASVDVGRKFGDQKQYGIRVNASDTHVSTGIKSLTGRSEFESIALDWKASDKLSFKFDYETYLKNVAEQGTIVPLKAVNGVIALPQTVNARNMLGVTWGIYTPRTVNQVFRADYQLSTNWSVMGEVGTSNSQRSRVQVRDINYNVLTGAGTAQVSWLKNQRYDNSFQTVELHGKFNTGPIKNDLTVGYTETERKGNNPFGFGQITTPTNIYNPVQIPTFADPNTPASEAPSKNTEKSFFFYDTLTLTPTVAVMVGARKSDQQFTSTNQKTFVQTTLKEKPTAPGFGLLWDVAPRTTVYGSFMRAFEDGGTAPAGAANEYQILAPNESTQKEIGIRSTYFKGMYVNADYFDIKRGNSVTSLQTGAHYNEFMYDGDVLLRGYEIAANAEINRFWSVSGTAQIMEGIQKPVYDLTLDGKAPENLAKNMGTFNVDYRPSYFVNGLTLRAGANYTGERFVNAANQAKIPSVVLYSAGASYKTTIGGKKSTFQLNVSNLQNKQYWNSAVSTALGAGMDRTYRFSVKTEF